MEDVKLEFPDLPQCKEDTEDWSYPMRREMQEILPGLFLGPYSAAMKSKVMFAGFGMVPDGCNSPTPHCSLRLLLGLFQGSQKGVHVSYILVGPLQPLGTLKELAIDTCKLSILQKYGITHIICIRQSIEANFIKPNFQHLFRYLVLDFADNPIENIIRFFPMSKEFIDGCSQTGGKVLIHGNAGISRSAALVIAYIMETFGLKYRDAFTYVQERRFCINPNAGFVHQLQEYEAIYLAKLTIKTMSPLQLGRTFSLQSGAAGSLKRTLEEDDELGNMQVSAAYEG